MAPIDRFVAETPIRVRYAETDAMRIVHHRNYIVYFEEGRSDYARKRGHPYSEMERDGIFLAVTEVHVRYVKAAIYEQKLKLLTWIDEVRSRRVRFSYEVVDAEDGTLMVTGTTSRTCITADGHVTRIPDAWRQWARQ